MPSPSPIKVSFSFYPTDMDALKTRRAALKKIGLPVRGGTILRALVYLTSPMEMLAHSLLLVSSYERKKGPREADNVAGHPTVDLPKDQIEKLDRVVDELTKKQVPANRALVVRAILRAAPPNAELAPAIRQFLNECPRRPRSPSARKTKG